MELKKQNRGSWGRKEKYNKMRERETGHKRLLIIGNKLRVAGGEVVGDGVTGCWALRRARDVMSTVYYMRLMNHWPLPLKQIIHYMLIKWI